MVAVIKQRIESIGTTGRQGKSRLRIVPIVGPSHSEPGYCLLTRDNADMIKVTEVSEAGSVPVLNVQNLSDARVFLMDGQELVGAKQNRILNTDVLVPAQSTVAIPVSCVEQGRWRHATPVFSPGKAASSSIRSRKSARVHEALKERRGHDANQQAVWNEVQSVMCSVRVDSPTAALHDAYAARERDLEETRKGLVLP
jgi:hypothetical protein